MEKLDFITPQHRYCTLDYYLKKRFNSKVSKISLNGNFTCPNRDGKVSYKGCVFCSEKGSGDFAGDPKDSITTQFNKVKDIISLKWPKSKYIAYFQANTNTYGPIDKLSRLFYEAINIEDVVVLSIATRPDCLGDDVLDLLEALNKIKPVWVELGLQTIHEETSKFINRGYNLEVFDNAVRKLRQRNIEVIVHIINGLPNETKEMMLETVKHLNNLDIQGIKIHSLYICDNSPLGKMYLSNPFKVLSLSEYLDIITSQLAILRSDIVVHRIMGDAPRQNLIEPTWSIKKLVVMNEIDKLMKEKCLYQSIIYRGTN